MAFTALINETKFKTAVNGLEPHPHEGESFFALQGTKKKGTKDFLGGLYIGSAMSADYREDRKKAPEEQVEIKGKIRRGAHPKKLVLVAPSGTLSTLKTIGKESIKASGLKYVIVAMRPSDQEPEPTPEELAELAELAAAEAMEELGQHAARRNPAPSNAPANAPGNAGAPQQTAPAGFRSAQPSGAPRAAPGGPNLRTAQRGVPAPTPTAQATTATPGAQQPPRTASGGTPPGSPPGPATPGGTAQQAANPGATAQQPATQPTPQRAASGNAATAAQRQGSAKAANRMAMHPANAVEQENYARRQRLIQVQMALAPELFDQFDAAVSQNDAATANQMLDAMLPALEAASKQKPLLKIAVLVQKEMLAVHAEGLDKLRDLSKAHDPVVAAVARGDVRGAAEAMQLYRDAVQEQRTAVRAVMDARVIRPLFRSEEFLDDNFKPADFCAKLAPSVGLTPEQCQHNFDLMMADLKKQADQLRPEGLKLPYPFNGNRNAINPLLPPQSRPKLSPQQAIAVNSYSKADIPAQSIVAPYKVMNNALRAGKKGKDIPPPHNETFKQLQEAFAQCKPFEVEQRMSRGMKFDEPEPLNKFLKIYQAAAGAGKMIPVNGFMSSGSAGIPKVFEGNVKVTIIAKLGLDCQPYTDSPKERELLLNHGTMFLVHKCAKVGNVWELELEQMLPVAKS